MEFGIVTAQESGHISRFIEKSAWGRIFSHTVYTGLCLLEPSILAEKTSILPKLSEAGRPPYGYVMEDHREGITGEFVPGA